MKNSTSDPRKGLHRDPGKEKFWRKTLREQAGCGQDIRAFCRARGLTETSFYAWRRTLAERDRGKKPHSGGQLTFVELCPNEAAPQPGCVPLEIVVGMRRLLVHPGCDGALLREVLAALGE